MLAAGFPPKSAKSRRNPDGRRSEVFRRACDRRIIDEGEKGDHMKIRDVMAAHVWTCRANEPARAAARLMSEHEFGAVPVVETDGTLVGIVTSRDLCRRAYLSRKAIDDLAVSDAMSWPVYTVEAGEPLAAAEHMMRSHRIRRLPVLEGGKLVGIVSCGDVARAEAARAGPADPEELSAMLREVVGPRAHLGGVLHVHDP